jgi:hypothetical protein
VISWLQESYLGNSNRSLVGCRPNDTHTLNPGGTINSEHWRPYQGPPELSTAHGGALGATGARGVGGGDAGGGVTVGGVNDAGVGGAGNASAKQEWRSPFIGYARSSGVGCQ